MTRERERATVPHAVPLSHSPFGSRLVRFSPRVFHLIIVPVVSGASRERVRRNIRRVNGKGTGHERGFPPCTAMLPVFHIPPACRWHVRIAVYLLEAEGTDDDEVGTRNTQGTGSFPVISPLSLFHLIFSPRIPSRPEGSEPEARKRKGKRRMVRAPMNETDVYRQETDRARRSISETWRDGT